MVIELLLMGAKLQSDALRTGRRQTRMVVWVIGKYSQNLEQQRQALRGEAWRGLVASAWNNVWPTWLAFTNPARQIRRCQSFDDTLRDQIV